MFQRSQGGGGIDSISSHLGVRLWGKERWLTKGLEMEPKGGLVIANPVTQSLLRGQSTLVLHKFSYLYENTRETRVVATRGRNGYHVLYMLRRASSLVRTVR